jgi:hypothetical protein
LSSSPSAKSEKDIRLGTNVLDGRGPGSDLPSEDVVEDVYGVLLPFEVDPVKVRQDQEQQAGIIGLLKSKGQNCLKLIAKTTYNITTKLVEEISTQYCKNYKSRR